MSNRRAGRCYNCSLTIEAVGERAATKRAKAARAEPGSGPSNQASRVRCSTTGRRTMFRCGATFCQMCIRLRVGPLLDIARRVPSAGIETD